MFEETLLNVLTGLVNGQIFWDTWPDAYNIKATPSLIVMQKIGGQAGYYVEKDNPMPSHRHARVQIETWGHDRLVVAPLARAVELAVGQCQLISQVNGAAVDLHVPELKLFGARQIFSFWYS